MQMLNMTGRQVATTAMQTELRDLLSRCTERQQQMFGRLYPEGIDKMDDEALARGIDQCNATLAKNLRNAPLGA